MSKLKKANFGICSYCNNVIETLDFMYNPITKKKLHDYCYNYIIHFKENKRDLNKKK